MYPSISICKKYAFDNSKVEFFDDAEMDTNKASEWIIKNSWGLESTVYFFTHPGVLNKTFPCTTTLGGTTPGKPCVFPIVWWGDTYDTCFNMNTLQPACLTKLKYWGNIYRSAQLNVYYTNF